MAPARTGRDNKSKTVVMSTDQTKRGVCSSVISLGRIFMMVVIKLIEPRIEDTPAK
jgi:hypothetical protein